MKKKIIATVIVVVAAISGYTAFNAEAKINPGESSMPATNCIPFINMECHTVSKNTDGAYEITIRKDAMSDYTPPIVIN